MKQETKSTIKNVVEQIADNYDHEPLFSTKAGKNMPERKVIIDALKELRLVMFPGYFGEQDATRGLPGYFVGARLLTIYNMLCEQIACAFAYNEEDAVIRAHSLDGMPDQENKERAETVCGEFFEELPRIQKLLLKDVQAAFDGDPAAQSKEEIIFSYPGLFAIFVYRIAHEFYIREVPFIPRIMTEYAHGKTGIDINSGAVIGESFFIDHGTGIVIGETTVIGNHVKLYQGVTLGGLSTRGGQKLSGSKRHPTIEDNVTIYSNASILGGNTVIGKNSVIGGNTFITESIPENSRISLQKPVQDEYDWYVI
ncbi:MAG: serine O-acetyltransferase [Roseburia sp.]|nr:serine O-acetyltransferase [Roseburia sp.]